MKSNLFQEWKVAHSAQASFPPFFLSLPFLPLPSEMSDAVPEPLMPTELSTGSIYQLHYVSWCQNELRHGRFLGHITKYIVFVDPNNPLSYGSDMPLWMIKERHNAKLQIHDDEGNSVDLDDVKPDTVYRIRRLRSTGEWGNEIKKTINVLRSDLMHFEILKPVHEPSERLVKTTNECYKIYRLGAAVGTDGTHFPGRNDDLRPMLKTHAAERRGHLVEFMKRERPWWFEKSA